MKFSPKEQRNVTLYDWTKLACKLCNNRRVGNDSFFKWIIKPNIVHIQEAIVEIQDFYTEFESEFFSF